MIRSFKHKGVERFFLDEDRRGINAGHAARLARILDRLDASASPQDMDLPGFRLHELRGRDKGSWSVSLSGNWRLVFKFEGNDAADVDYVDYH